MNGWPVGLLGTGIYLPEKIMHNSELEVILGLELGYIEKRTGIKERRWTSNEEDVLSMAAEASVIAVKNANVKKIDRIIVCRDAIFTKRACSVGLPVMERLEVEGVNVDDAFSIDIANYCTSFVHALHIAELMVRHDNVENILVIASTDFKDLINISPEFHLSFNDKFEFVDMIQQYSIKNESYYQPPRLNSFLWGCGAGAAIIGRSNLDNISNYVASSSRKARKDSYGIGETIHGKAFIAMDGRVIYEFAITELPDFLQRYLSSSGLQWSDIDFLVPHQPNPRILKALGKRLSLPPEKILVSCDLLGNLIAASPLVTYHLNKKIGRIQSGMTLLFCSFGDSYLSMAACLVRL